MSLLKESLWLHLSAIDRSIQDKVRADWEARVGVMGEIVEALREVLAMPTEHSYSDGCEIGGFGKSPDDVLKMWYHCKFCAGSCYCDDCLKREFNSWMKWYGH